MTTQQSPVPDTSHLTGVQVGEIRKGVPHTGSTASSATTSTPPSRQGKARPGKPAKVRPPDAIRCLIMAWLGLASQAVQISKLAHQLAPERGMPTMQGSKEQAPAMVSRACSPMVFLSTDRSPAGAGGLAASACLAAQHTMQLDPRGRDLGLYVRPCRLMRGPA